MKNERLHGFLATASNLRQFNLGRAPWWGREFERIVKITKKSFCKTVGKTLLTLSKMEKVLLDADIVLNKRPLIWVENNDQFAIVTSNSLIQKSNMIPENDPEKIIDKDIWERAQFTNECKKTVWFRVYITQISHELTWKTQRKLQIKAASLS